MHFEKMEGLCLKEEVGEGETDKGTKFHFYSIIPSSSPLIRFEDGAMYVLPIEQILRQACYLYEEGATTEDMLLEACKAALRHATVGCVNEELLAQLRAAIAKVEA